MNKEVLESKRKMQNTEILDLNCFLQSFMIANQPQRVFTDTHPGQVLEDILTKQLCGKSTIINLHGSLLTPSHPTIIDCYRPSATNSIKWVTKQSNNLVKKRLLQEAGIQELVQPSTKLDQ